MNALCLVLGGIWLAGALAALAWGLSLVFELTSRRVARAWRLRRDGVLECRPERSTR